MKSRRPSINTGRQKPTRMKRVEPKIYQPRQLGICLLCGEAVKGPAAVRLRHGAVTRRKWGTEFIELPFEDRDLKKWICYGCAADSYIIEEQGLSFSAHLDKLSPDGWCCLCHQDIEPYPLEDWSSAISIELGTMTPSQKGNGDLFRVRQQGHLHFMCMDDLNVELWRLIERTDTPDPPDYDDWLRQCG